MSCLGEKIPALDFWRVEKVLFLDKTYFIVWGQHSRYIWKHRNENF
jgi:hypothetical protein